MTRVWTGRGGVDRIGVGVYGTESSAPAIRWARAEAVIRSAELALIHAWDIPVDVSVDVALPELSERPGSATYCAVADTGTNVMAAQDTSLLVFSRRDARRRSAQFCVHRPTCPTVVVPDQDREPTGRIVVGVCDTPGARHAFRWAVEEARLRGAELVAVQAWQVQPASVHDVVLEVFHPSRVVADVQPRAEEQLDRWVREMRAPAGTVTHAVHGAPLDELLTASDSADLIVLGHHDHSAWHQAFHGHLRTELVRLAACPVAVIPDCG